MRSMTDENAKAAFAGESQAHLKYLNFAQKAAEEGKENVARLFRAASYSEQVHASNHLRLLDGIHSTADNLADAAAGEKLEVSEMYPAYMIIAADQDEKDARRSFNLAYQTEKAHLALCDRAGKAVEAGEDASAEALWVCDRCGFTMEGRPREKCPLCGNPKKSFVKF